MEGYIEYNACISSYSLLFTLSTFACSYYGNINTYRYDLCLELLANNHLSDVIIQTHTNCNRCSKCSNNEWHCNNEPRNNTKLNSTQHVQHINRCSSPDNLRECSPRTCINQIKPQLNSNKQQIQKCRRAETFNYLHLLLGSQKRSIGHGSLLVWCSSIVKHYKNKERKEEDKRSKHNKPCKLSVLLCTQERNQSNHKKIGKDLPSKCTHGISSIREINNKIND